MRRPGPPPSRHPTRRFLGALAAALLALAGCTTEFVPEGTTCEGPGECAPGQVCREVRALGDGGPIDAGNICLRACATDNACSSALGQRCLKEDGADGGVCGRQCVIDSDCVGDQRCRFSRCQSPAPVPDARPIVDAAPLPEPDPDGGAGDGTVDDRDGGMPDAFPDAIVDPMRDASADAIPPPDAETADAQPVDAIIADAVPAADAAR